MAAADRTSPLHIGFLEALAPELRDCGLFPVVRGAEARAPRLPKVGKARRPADNVVDLAQTPTLGFPAAALHELRAKHGRATLTGYWFGLTGPMGALPTYLTEFAAYEQRYAKTQPFGDFLDMLAGRMLQLFYRAWADSQPAAQADRPDDDSFALYLAALSGAAQGVAGDAAFPAWGRLHYASLFAARRSPAAIEDALTALIGTRVRINEYQPRWREIELDDRSRLGRSFSTLGRDVLLGARSRQAADAFRVFVGTEDLPTYRRLLPTGALYPIVAEALDAFSPSHIEWDIALEIDAAKAPPARLDGRAALGWLSWLGRGPQGNRDDAHLRRRTRHRGRRA